MRKFGRLGLGLAALLFATVIGAAPVAADNIGPDYVSSDNVEFLTNIRLPGQAVGAKVIGNYMYVSSSKDVEIYDISNPASPQLTSQLTDLEIGWENEQLPTNGRILGFSQAGSGYAFFAVGGCFTVNQTTNNCLVIWDVTDKANPRIIQTISGAGDHTSTCMFDCQYMVGSAGSVTDLRHINDPGHPAQKISVGAHGWQTGLPGKSCHNQTEVSPGVLLAACQPFMLLSMRAQDGASVIHPKLLATGSNIDGRFIHGVDWPGQGTDKFALAAGETNVVPRCDVQRPAAFMTWDATRVGDTHKFWMIDEFRLQNGDYVDGSPPANVSGCSTHWFEAHKSFHDGGLVALANYEHGIRFMQIQPNGHIVQVGFFEGLGGAASAAHWAPSGNIVYSIDYQRGIDVIRWKGPLYVPGSATVTSQAPVPTTGAVNTPNTSRAPGGQGIARTAAALALMLLGGAALTWTRLRGRISRR